jgi:hypothetical protein
MPKNIVPLQLRCQEVMGRVSPMASPHPSDDETSVREENEESLVENNAVVHTNFGKYSEEFEIKNEQDFLVAE